MHASQDDADPQLTQYCNPVSLAWGGSSRN